MCFLVDCTGSMQNSIEAVKNNITVLRSSLVAEYKQCELLFSFVRYTDYDQPSHSRTTFLNFTRYMICELHNDNNLIQFSHLYSDSSAFQTFVGCIRAGGGGDGPEDIMGGLQVTFHNLSWRPKANKVFIIIVVTQF